FQDFLPELREFGAAMINHRAVHGAEHAIRDVGGTGNLQKMTARMNHARTPWKETSGNQSATFRISLPRFSPRKSFSKVSGNVWKPSTMSSFDLSLPAAIQPAISRAASPYREA